MQTLMLSCRKAAELIERRSFGPLAPVQAIQLYMHTRICRGCGAYQRQSGLLDSFLEHREDGFVALPTEQLEKRIIDAVNTDNSGTT